MWIETVDSHNFFLITSTFSKVKWWIQNTQHKKYDAMKLRYNEIRKWILGQKLSSYYHHHRRLKCRKEEKKKMLKSNTDRYQYKSEKRIKQSRYINIDRERGREEKRDENSTFCIFNGIDFHFFSSPPFVVLFVFNFIVNTNHHIYTQDVRIIVAVIFIHSNKNKLFYEAIKIANGQKHILHTQTYARIHINRRWKNNEK